MFQVVNKQSIELSFSKKRVLVSSSILLARSHFKEHDDMKPGRGKKQAPFFAATVNLSRTNSRLCPRGWKVLPVVVWVKSGELSVVDQAKRMLDLDLHAS